VVFLGLVFLGLVFFGLVFLGLVFFGLVFLYGMKSLLLAPGWRAGSASRNRPGAIEAGGAAYLTAYLTIGNTEYRGRRWISQNGTTEVTFE
jgi:hypothetical protein